MPGIRGRDREEGTVVVEGAAVGRSPPEELDRELGGDPDAACLGIEGGGESGLVRMGVGSCIFFC